MDKSKVLDEPKPPSKMTKVQKSLKGAIETGNLEEFEKILKENPKEDVNFTDEDKMTPLQQASYRGNTVMVKVLLERVRRCLSYFLRRVRHDLCRERTLISANTNTTIPRCTSARCPGTWTCAICSSPRVSKSTR